MIRDIIKQLFIDDAIPKLSFTDLQNVPEMVNLEDTPGMVYRRIPYWGDGGIYFHGWFEAGCTLDKHYHDCKEIVHIMDGILEYKGQQYKQGDRIVLQAYVQHEFYAPVKTEIFTEFRPPNL